MIEESEPSNQDVMDELDEHLAFLSRKFSKLKFKRSPDVSKPFRKDFQSNTNYIERSKFKCFNCEMGGHFANEFKKPKAEKSDRKFEPVDYKKKYFDLHRQKGRAFITQDYDWAEDGNDSEEDTEFVNLALMADSSEQEASSSSNQVITTNLSELSTEECNSTINDMSTELYHMRISLKSLTKENTRIKDANQFLSDRNAVLETQFIEFEKMRVECQVAKDDLLTVLKREEILKAQLAKEHETIARWTDSRNVAINIIKAQGVDTFYKKSVRKDKKKLDVENLGDDTSMDNEHPLKGNTSTDSKHPLMGNTSTDVTCPKKCTSSVSQEKLEKLNKKYGPTNKNFVQGECSETKAKDVNIGHLSNKQLKGKLENIEVKDEVKKKKNRNGKVGINKHNNYTPDKYAPRKTCVKCGSVNHLSTNYKTVKTSSVQMPMPVPNMPMPAMHNMFVHTGHASNLYANMPFVSNPYMDAFKMPQMTWSMPQMNTMYAQNSQMPASNIYAYEHPQHVVSQRSTPRVKVYLTQREIKGNRKNLWYLDSGCSRHMTGDSTLLTEFVEKAGPSITFGDDNKGYTKGYGLISKENVIIDEVALVYGLKHNLLSISQLCDKGFSVSFNQGDCVVSNKENNNVVLIGHIRGNVYIVDFNSTSSDSITCLLSKASKDESWLWHKRLSHLNFKSMNDLVRRDLVRGLPQLEFSKDGLCDACQKRKQKMISFRSKLD
ncbi:hypothetical protein POM88_017939 [Heracleum sosnowskyi]|uniref:GAG-pre-integrase domain-containing protein n=1 Tax=Heracleum sosnowskyi TaxID=360622 RepID=A0AAD8MYN8_9APIA|nr:hypothetical protein POM88_017939 [Heracleum sosnowskyi]